MGVVCVEAVCCCTVSMKKERRGGGRTIPVVPARWVSRTFAIGVGAGQRCHPCLSSFPRPGRGVNIITLYVFIHTSFKV